MERSYRRTNERKGTGVTTIRPAHVRFVSVGCVWLHLPKHSRRIACLQVDAGAAREAICELRRVCLDKILTGWRDD